MFSLFTPCQKACTFNSPDEFLAQRSLDAMCCFLIFKNMLKLSLGLIESHVRAGADFGLPASFSFYEGESSSLLQWQALAAISFMTHYSCQGLWYHNQIQQIVERITEFSQFPSHWSMV